MPRKDKDDSKKLVETIKDRYDIMVEADQEMRDLAMRDMKFVNVPGEQWDENMKKERGLRPCFEFNKLRVSCKRIINDMRANRPAAKVRPVEGGDKKVAEIEEGLIRNIWNRSDGESITDYQAEYQVGAGMCAWRVTSEYADDDVFEQDLWIRNIENPFSLHCDPSSRDVMKRDAEDWILTERISHAAFERRFPKAEPVNFDSIDQYEDDDDWIDEDTVRIAEYWYKKPITKELWQLADGTVVDSESDEAGGIPEEAIKRRREVKTEKICWCIANGQEIIEGPEEWAGRNFPFVLVYGEYVVIDGKTYWWGLPRFAKDAQRSYNFARTAIAETIAQAPKAQFWATTKQAEGLEEQWATAQQQNFPFMLYNPDDKAPGSPQRMGGADIPVALIQEAQIASDEIKAVTGIFDASMGAQSNETSGRAIYARQQQGEISTFNYQDNMSKGVQRTYEILLDLIPEIYDTERELRVLGSDGAEDYVKINEISFDIASGRPVRINDLSKGKYDVTVTTGPNFATQRQEAAETYTNLVQKFPDAMGVAGDLIFKSLDLPYADEIAERLQALLPPQVQQMLSEGKDIPPEAQAVMQQANQAMQMAQQVMAEAEQAAVDAEKSKAQSDADKAAIKADLADLRAAKAEFDKHIAEETANLIKQKADLVMDKTQVSLDKSANEQGKTLNAHERKMIQELINSKLDDGTLDVEDVGNLEMGNTDMKYQELLEKVEKIDSLDNILAQFMQAADSAMNQVANRKPVDGSIRRENGQLVATVKYDDGTEREIRAKRENGELKLVS